MEVKQIILFLVLSACALVTASTGTPNSCFVGKFECHKYDKSGKNNWHYVTITFDQTSGTYKWSNKAGRTWTLYPSEVAGELKVGPDCPYYNKGHIVAKFTSSGVYGPWNEFYSKEFGNTIVTGKYENHQYDNGGKNDWHYVTITYDATNNKYTWTNRAGRSWSLYSSAKANELRVGEDCPYYSRGHTIAKVNQMGIYGPWNEFYTRTKVNPWFIGNFENMEYSGSAKNNWHYVTITYNENLGRYTWANRAGVKWTLYPTQKDNELRVGTDCPYYKNGHTTAKVDNKGIYGPWGELYTRK